MKPDTARRILGIGRDASAEAIRAAWKVQVRRYHPDRPGGSAEKLMLASDAYQVLTDGSARVAVEPEVPEPKAESEVGRGRDEAPDLRRVGGRRSARGSAPVPGAEQASCRERLEGSRQQRGFMVAKQAKGGFYGDPARTDGTEAAAEHVASRLEMDEGWLLFVVEAPMRRGWNSVALPTGQTQGRRSVVISFEAERSGGGCVPLDPAAARECYPWAENVEIAFRAA